MTRWTMTALLCLLLAGCETMTAPLMTESLTPEAVRARGSRTEHSLKGPPQTAARCIERNAEGFARAPMQATSRSTDEAGAVEVQMRLDRLIALALVRPQGAGSTATIWLAPLPLARRDEWVPALINGC